MGYDEKKDVLIKLFEHETPKGSLQISIFSYNNGAPKIQINRRYVKNDGTAGYGQMGRLIKEEIEFLFSNQEEISELMTNV